MKRKILFIVLLFLTGITIYSKDIFPKSDAIWNIKMPSECGDQYRYAILLGLMGDTLINDTTYQKLYLLNDTILRKESVEHYMGAIRQEDERVWMRVDHFLSENENRTREFLLCDFSLKIGDQFTYGDILFTKIGALEFPTIIFEDNSVGQIKSNPIGRVDSITIDERGRRHFNITYLNNYHDEWVEGIGSFHGLFFHFYYPPMYLLGEEHKSRLQCMKYKDEVIYRKEEKGAICQQCFCMSHFVVEIHEEVVGDIRLYVPESCRKSICIEVLNGSLPCRIELYDISGTLVFTETIRENNTTVNLDHLGGGTYIYRLSRYGKAMQRGKFMIN